MSHFSAAWLALRESADDRARWPGAAAGLASWPALRRSGLVVDLGSGTGANFRHLASRLDAAHEWLLVDHDAALLAQAEATCGLRPTARPVRTLQIDLAMQLARVPLHGAALLTASALLDLVSEDWLVQLAQHCQAAAVPVLLTLNYDGHMDLAPADVDDAFVRDAVNLHQRRDKGFGPALGPTAVAMARRAFAARGYEVCTARSDWRLDAQDAPLQRALVEGWAEAAAEMRPAETERVRGWRQRRLAAIDAGHSRIVVGHEDLLALPGRATLDQNRRDNALAVAAVSSVLVETADRSQS